ncbi:MAG TPA: hypothetical protein VD994_06395 [Prosthecobacter sp.]|nr:hypothetical protein [Prosthecobacter sp.]
METPPSPPLFVPNPAPPPPPAKSGSLKWVLFIVLAVVIVIAVLTAVTVPAYRTMKRKAQEAGERRLEAAKPKLPLSAPDKAAVDAFGARVARAVNEKDTAFLASVTDSEAMADRVFVPLGDGIDTQQAKRGFINGLQRNASGLFNNVMGSEVKFMSQGERDGFPTVRLRVMFESGAVSFIDLLVRLDRSRTVKAVDIFTFVFGSYATTEARNAMLLMMTKDQSSPLRVALGMKDYDPVTTEALIKMSTALRLGRGEEIVSQYKGLSQALKNERMFFLIYLQGLTTLQSESDEMNDLYRAALMRAPELLGEESATDFLRVDLQFMDNDFAGAEESLRKTEDKVGRDAYLTQMRALMFLRLNKVDEAQRLEREARKMEPDLLSLVDLRLLIHAARKDYPALVNELRELKTARQVVITREQLTEPEYEEFLKSPEFANWEEENR